MLNRRSLLALASTVVALAALALAGEASAVAAPAIELTRGASEPVESVTTQLGAVVSNGGGDYFILKVKPTGGEACGANPNADSGYELIGENVTSASNPVSISRNYTFQLAGDYRVCAWVTGESTEDVLTSAEATFHVRQPHLTLSVSAPATAPPNQTFQIATTAKAETERSVWEYLLPNTGDGCPANANAAYRTSGERQILGTWRVTGGPFTETKNESLSTPGVYLLCAYFEYPN